LIGLDDASGRAILARMSRSNLALRLCAGAGIVLLGGCVFMPSVDPFAGQSAPASSGMPDPGAPRLPSLETRHIDLDSDEQEVIGELQVLFARYENTFVTIARAYDLGYEELRAANPGVDVWLPGDNTPVYLPTALVLPDAPRDGIVLNLPSMRLLYFTKTTVDGATHTSVTSHPIGIGREGWATPVGTAEVTQKARDPTWYPPASVRAEHEGLGDPLPSVVPPGPDNPLGAFALRLSMPGYLIHGTNKPAGVGMRVSHGCIRLYPEDIEALFDRVPEGTPVYIVDQPVLAGWHEGRLYLEVHTPLAEDQRDLGVEAERVLAAALERAGTPELALDDAAVAQIVAERRGIPLPVLRTSTPEPQLAGARIVENTVPIDATESTANNEP
jgi:L,D-transpeptidase ErfK/SrfK